MRQQPNGREVMPDGEHGGVLDPLTGALERSPCQGAAVESTEVFIGYEALRSRSRTRRRRRKRSWAGRLAPILLERPREA